MKILIKGAGDLASGIACRLHECGFNIVMTDIAVPTTVRRTVAFSRAIYEGKAQVENSTGILCHDIDEIDEVIAQRDIAVVVDPEAGIIKQYRPDVVVDAIIAKRNLGTTINDASVVIGVGPGFRAGVDCHCVVETKRGHYLGKCIYEGSAIPNTGVPGDIGGYTVERILRAPAAGIFRPAVEIGTVVEKGDICGYVEDTAMCSLIPGVVRGLLQDGVEVTEGMKAGDVDPRCAPQHCMTVSDKARAIGGGVLEAIMHLANRES